MANIRPPQQPGKVSAGSKSALRDLVQKFEDLKQKHGVAFIAQHAPAVAMAITGQCHPPPPPSQPALHDASTSASQPALTKAGLKRQREDEQMFGGPVSGYNLRHDQLKDHASKLPTNDEWQATAADEGFTRLELKKMVDKDPQAVVSYQVVRQRSTRGEGAAAKGSLPEEEWVLALKGSSGVMVYDRPYAPGEEQHHVTAQEYGSMRRLFCRTTATGPLPATRFHQSGVFFVRCVDTSVHNAATPCMSCRLVHSLQDSMMLLLILVFLRAQDLLDTLGMSPDQCRQFWRVRAERWES